MNTKKLVLKFNTKKLVLKFKYWNSSTKIPILKISVKNLVLKLLYVQKNRESDIAISLVLKLYYHSLCLRSFVNNTARNFCTKKSLVNTLTCI